MTETYLTAEQAKAFLAAHPSVQWIDVFMHDLNGIGRGKRIRSADLIGFADKGFMVPSTCYIMDMRGSCVEETGRLWETGDPDLQFRVLADTLAPGCPCLAEQCRLHRRHAAFRCVHRVEGDGRRHASCQ